MPLSLKFKDFLHPRPAPSGIDVNCKLKHFAIITYAVDAHRFAGLLPPRFKLDTIFIDGQEKGLLSVVPFMDVDFTSAVYPFPVFSMGQTNYRIYIIDTTTGERCVWFLGTILDSWTIMVPRHIWKLPWHPGKMRFICDFDQQSGCYRHYEMHTKAKWAPARVQLKQQPEQQFHFQGFADNETALVYLTHPLAGFYYRRNGKLGTYRVWHDRLAVKPATLESAQFALLSRMKLVQEDEQQQPYSVLLQPINEFTIYLPPTAL